MCNEKMIDTHVHLGKWTTNYFYNLENSIKDIEKVYKDYHGIVVMPTETLENAKVANILKRSPLKTKFAAWGTPGNYHSLKRLEFDAIKIHPAFSDTFFSDPLYDPLVELAERREVPMLVHCGSAPHTHYMNVIYRAEKFPRVKFVIGHLGGKPYQYQWRCPLDIKRLTNVYIDTTMRVMWWTLEHCQRIIGSERMMFGSDYPLMHPSVGVASILNADLNHEDVLYNTAHNIFWK